jgi:hypothetical protein
MTTISIRNNQKDDIQHNDSQLTDTRYNREGKLLMFKPTNIANVNVALDAKTA